jgi:hypothetical protein
MNFPGRVFFGADKGGRRSGIDRRQFSYSEHIPERRSGADRRSGKDRRSGGDRRKRIEHVISVERRNGLDRRGGLTPS